jgi:hypothetical protein
VANQGMFKLMKQDITKGIYQLTDGSFTINCLLWLTGQGIYGLIRFF